MSDVRRVTLTNKVGKILADLYPDAGGCNILALTDRQVSIIRQMVYPYAYWPTRFVNHVHSDEYITVAGQLRSEHIDEVDDLLAQLEACNMGCHELTDAITQLALAIAERDDRRCITNVNCGSGGLPSNAQGLLNALSQYDESKLLPAEDIVEEPAGDPPDGFETWEEYYQYKCSAANWIVDTIIGSLRNLGMLPIAVGSLGTISAGVGAALALLAGIAPPVALISVAGIMVQLAVVGVGANAFLRQVADNLAAQRQAIVCAMFNSGSASAAVSAITGFIDDAIEALVYTGVWEGLGSTISPLLGAIASQVVDLHIVRSMFQLTADVVYPDADCSGCDQWAGYLVVTGQQEPYNTVIRGSNPTFANSNAAQGFYVQHPTAGRIYFSPTGPVTTLRLQGEYYHHQVNWTVLGVHVARTSDDQIVGSFVIPDSNGSWRTYDSTRNISLSSGVSYYLRFSPAGGNSTWNRRISLEAVA